MPISRECAGLTILPTWTGAVIKRDAFGGTIGRLYARRYTGGITTCVRTVVCDAWERDPLTKERLIR